MKYKSYVIRYISEIFDYPLQKVKFRIIAKDALQEADFLISLPWVHRVEVWDGDRRMLLAVQ